MTSARDSLPPAARGPGPDPDRDGVPRALSALLRAGPGGAAPDAQVAEALQAFGAARECRHRVPLERLLAPILDGRSIVPNELATDERLTAQDVRVYLRLAFYARTHVFPGVVALAGEVRLTPERTARSVLALEACGLLLRRAGPQGPLLELLPPETAYREAVVARPKTVPSPAVKLTGQAPHVALALAFRKARHNDRWPTAKTETIAFSQCRAVLAKVPLDKALAVLAWLGEHDFWGPATWTPSKLLELEAEYDRRSRQQERKTARQGRLQRLEPTAPAPPIPPDDDDGGGGAEDAIPDDAF
jgi:hypothetical protein